MALIRCYECNEKISHLAESCPSCGAPPETDGKKLQSLIKISEFESTIENLQKRKDKFDKFLGYVVLWFLFSILLWSLDNEILSRMGKDMVAFSAIVGFILAQISYSRYEKKIKDITKKIQFEENWEKTDN